MPLKPGEAAWWAAKPRCIAAKRGSDSHVSRGGRGWGNWVSHISSPCAPGSAWSRRCRIVVPVRGRPMRKIGRSIRTPSCSGWAANAASVSRTPVSALLTSERWKARPRGVSPASGELRSSTITRSPSSCAPEPKSESPVERTAAATMSSYDPTSARSRAMMLSLVPVDVIAVILSGVTRSSAARCPPVGRRCALRTARA